MPAARDDILERQEFQSKSSPDQYYETVVRSDGLVACNCRGWTMKKEGKPRQCVHTGKVIGSRPTVDDGTYIYIARLADRVVKYRAAKIAQATNPRSWVKPIEPPPVEPPIMRPPGRRRIVFED